MPTANPTAEHAAPGERAYRAFLLDRNGSVRTAVVLNVETDIQARAVAATMINAFGLILWERARFLASYPPLAVA